MHVSCAPLSFPLLLSCCIFALFPISVSHISATLPSEIQQNETRQARHIPLEGFVLTGNTLFFFFQIREPEGDISGLG